MWHRPERSLTLVQYMFLMCPHRKKSRWVIPGATLPNPHSCELLTEELPQWWVSGNAAVSVPFAGRCVQQVPVAQYCQCLQQMSLVFTELLLHWLICTTLSILGDPVLVPSHHDNSEIPKMWETASSISTHCCLCQEWSQSTAKSNSAAISEATPICTPRVLPNYALHHGLLN